MTRSLSTYSFSKCRLRGEPLETIKLTAPLACGSMEIVDNTEARRFETTVDGHRAELAYRRHGNRIVLIHTEVPEELEGNGLGGALVTAAIEDAIEHSLTIVPQCSFARDWLERHPDVAARARIDWHA